MKLLKKFSLLLDGSTDAANVENELILAMLFDKEGVDEKVVTHSQLLKGLVESKIPWIFWMWCLAHRLELAIKDALKGSSFDDVDEMLLRLYYLYHKSPKKCHQLEEIIVQVRGCILDDSTACKGKKPISTSGTRWIAHK